MYVLYIVEFNVDSRLLRASSLLSQLQSQQSERLSLPPYTSSEGHLLLHPPSEEEVGVAMEVRQELASLVAEVRVQIYEPPLDLNTKCFV